MNKALRTLRVKATSEPGKNKIKRIEFDGFPPAIRVGVHTGFCEFFGMIPEEPLPSTLDLVVAAVVGCLTGTLSGALEKRGISASPQNLQAEAEGQLENIDGKLILTAVSVKYRLKVPKEKRETVERVLQVHDSACPVSASVRRGITVQWSADVEEE